MKVENVATAAIAQICTKVVFPVIGRESQIPMVELLPSEVLFSKHNSINGTRCFEILVFR
jgi:hypothetical protein